MRPPNFLVVAALGMFCAAIVAAPLPGPVSSLEQAAGQPPESKPVDYSGEAAVVEKYEVTYRYNADGTGEVDTLVRMRIQNQAGVQQFSVLAFPFAAATQKAQITKLVAHHADGTSTETPASDSMEMPAPVTQVAPLYSDLKTLQIPVRSLRAGDVLEYEVRIELANSEAPSQFWGSYVFPKGMVILSEKLTLDVPATKYVQQWSSKLQPSVSDTGGQRVYVWATSQLKPTAPE